MRGRREDTRTQSFMPRCGFTLIELMAVVGIVILLAGITFPAVRTLTRGNAVSQAHNQISSYLIQARAIAMAQHRQAGVVFFRETPDHASPFHGGQIAMQIFVEDYDQQTVPAHNPRNTLFMQYSTAREYLPAEVAVGALNDMPTKLVINEDSTGGHNLTILFDSTGQLITRHGVARRNLPSSGTPGSYPWALADWHFASQGTVNSDNSSNGISSPGIFLYDAAAFESQPIAIGAAGDKARGEWIKKNASVITVNANTGLLQ
jgi:prepilin-type N-terminal cleavage/methylation domain-containing protein